MSQAKKVFDHAILSSKAICIQFLREFGVQRDWARCSLGEMRQMLKAYPDEKMFAAAQKIVERDGEPFNRADYECDVSEANDQPDTDDDDDNLPPDTSSAPATPAAPAPKPAAPAVAPTPSPAPAAKASADPADVDHVAKLLADLLARGKQSLDVEGVVKIANDVFKSGSDSLMAAINTLVHEAVKDVAPREIVVKQGDTSVTIDGLQHFEFETLLRACSARKADSHRHNIWLYGPPGTGKTTAARNVAQALGMAFYCTGALLTKYDITGFVDAGGKLVRTPFREAWENGGVYLFDEIDGSAPGAVVAFNAALANGIMAFPDKMVERHADCVVIAAANTNGLGATAEFTGRMKLDLATLDRFEFIEWPVDENIETALSSNKEWARIVQRVRANVQSKGVKGVAVTPRATIAGCSLLAQGLSMDAVKKMVLRKTMSAEQWAMVAA